MGELKATDAAEIHAEIERLAREKAVPEVRFIESIEIGKVVRQGDIYIHRIAEGHETGAPIKTRKLAQGDGEGSRHVAEAPAEVFEGVKLPEWCRPRTFLGPCIVSAERFVVTHPEHAHVSLPPGVYQVTHQEDALTGQRVVD